MLKTIELEVNDFNCADTFECGQCFRYHCEEDGSYTIVVFSQVVNVSYDKGILSIKDCTGKGLRDIADTWKKYFDAERDYCDIKRRLTKDPVLADAVKTGEGIHILNQDEWETLISFIISQNSNIPKIKSSIEKICKKNGRLLCVYNGREYYDFPNITELSRFTVEELRECGLGYRAAYLFKVSQKISEDNGKSLYSLKNQASEEALAYLLSLTGVGPKVANCILLFSMEKYERFPVDVWMKKIMEEYYGLEGKSVGEIESFATDKFKEVSGIAQQYLFHYIRNGQ